MRFEGFLNALCYYLFMNFIKTLHKNWYLGILIVILAAGALGIYDWYENNKEFVVLTDAQLEELGSTRAVMKYYEHLEEAYADDTFGGGTPEETLNLFVTALEAGDIETASRYYVLEAQIFERESLEEFSASDKYSKWIEIISDATLVEKTEEEANFQYVVVVAETRKIEGTSLVMPSGEYQNTIKIIKNSNGVWKISDL